MPSPTPLAPHSDSLKNGRTSDHPRLIAAMITPCREIGVPDTETMMHLSSRLSRLGCDGLFVASSTGEAPLLAPGQRAALVEAARVGADGRATIFAGATGLGVTHTLEMIRQLAGSGADVAVVMVPGFLTLAPEETLAYFSQIADLSPLPLAIYNHMRMPTAVDLNSIEHLAKHPNVVAIKDSSRDLERFNALCRIAAEAPEGKLAVYQGTERLLIESLQAGGTGFLMALAGVVPEWYCEMTDAWDRGDHEGCFAAHRRIADLAEIFKMESISISFSRFSYALRRATARRGWITGYHGMINGFTPDPAFDRELDAIFDQCGLAETLPPAISLTDLGVPSAQS